MLRLHAIANGLNPLPLIVKDLLVADHPPAVENKNERCKLKLINHVAHQYITK